MTLLRKAASRLVVTISTCRVITLHLMTQQDTEHMTRVERLCTPFCQTTQQYMQLHRLLNNFTKSVFSLVERCYLMQGNILSKLLGQAGSGAEVNVGSPPRTHLPPGPAANSPTHQKLTETGASVGSTKLSMPMSPLQCMPAQETRL